MPASYGIFFEELLIAVPVGNSVPVAEPKKRKPRVATEPKVEPAVVIPVEPVAEPKVEASVPPVVPVVEQK